MNSTPANGRNTCKAIPSTGCLPLPLHCSQDQARWLFQQLVVGLDFSHRMVSAARAVVWQSVLSAACRRLGGRQLVGRAPFPPLYCVLVQGVSNRDLKLENVLLMKDQATGHPMVKICDFGACG